MTAEAHPSIARARTVRAFALSVGVAGVDMRSGYLRRRCALLCPGDLLGPRAPDGRVRADSRARSPRTHPPHGGVASSRPVQSAQVSARGRLAARGPRLRPACWPKHRAGRSLRLAEAFVLAGASVLAQGLRAGRSLPCWPRPAMISVGAPMMIGFVGAPIITGTEGVGSLAWSSRRVGRLWASRSESLSTLNVASGWTATRRGARAPNR